MQNKGLLILIGSVALFILFRSLFAFFRKEPVQVTALPKARSTRTTVKGVSRVQPLLFNGNKKAYKVKSLAGVHAICSSYRGELSQQFKKRPVIALDGTVYSTQSPLLRHYANNESSPLGNAPSIGFEVNPTTGLPMTNGYGSVDVAGNAYGMGSMFGED